MVEATAVVVPVSVEGLAVEFMDTSFGVEAALGGDEVVGAAGLGLDAPETLLAYSGFSL